MSDTKPGYQTTEFWVVLGTAAVAALEAVRGSVSGTAGLIVAGVLAALYAVLRTKAKAS